MDLGEALLPAARAAGYAGSPRNFRRLVAAQKQVWRRDHHRGRRPAVWSPAEHLVIDWGSDTLYRGLADNSVGRIIDTLAPQRPHPDRRGRVRPAG